MDQVSVTVDGQAVPSAALGAPRAMNPGTHSIKASANGYNPAEQSVTVAEGERKNVVLVLVAAPGAVVAAAPVPAPAALAPADTAAAAQPPPPPPPTTPAPEAATAPPSPPPVEEPGPSNTLSTLGFIGTGVFGVAGAVTGGVAFAQASDVKGKCSGNSCPPSSQSEANSSSTMGTISTVTFILAGGSLLLGILTHHSAEARRRRHDRLHRRAGRHRRRGPVLTISPTPAALILSR